MINIDLKEIGIENRDKKVYEALYAREKSSLRQLAQDTGLNRGTVYEVVKKLTDIGLISFTQIGSRRHYIAAEPDIIMELIRERREQLKEQQTTVQAYIKQLRDQSGGVQPNYFATFYEGDEGIATILRDVIQTVRGTEAKEYHVMSSKRVSSFIYNNFPSFTRRRLEAELFVKVISDTASSERSPLSERKVLLHGSEALNGYTIIYGDRVAFISLSDSNVLSGIVITDSGVANMQRLVFKKLWNSPDA